MENTSNEVDFSYNCSLLAYAQNVSETDSEHC